MLCFHIELEECLPEDVSGNQTRAFVSEWLGFIKICFFNMLDRAALQLLYDNVVKKSKFLSGWMFFQDIWLFWLHLYDDNESNKMFTTYVVMAEIHEGGDKESL